MTIIYFSVLTWWTAAYFNLTWNRCNLDTGWGDDGWCDDLDGRSGSWSHRRGCSARYLLCGGSSCCQGGNTGHLSTLTLVEEKMKTNVHRGAVWIVSLNSYAWLINFNSIRVKASIVWRRCIWWIHFHMQYTLFFTFEEWRYVYSIF